MLGGFLKSIGGAVGLAPEIPEFNIPPTLPNMQARTAADLVSQAGIVVPPGSPDPATQTVPQFLSQKLNTEQDMLGATQALAHGLPEKSSLQWATDSAKMVEAKLPPAQKEALAAAEAFNAQPTLANRDLAAQAADKAGLHAPGGLAAKAASFAAVAGAPAIAGGDKALPGLVVGAVVMAVSISPPAAPKVPEVPPAPKLEVPSAPKFAAPQPLPAKPLAPVLPQPRSPAANRNASNFKPFIDRGLKLAGG